MKNKTKNDSSDEKRYNQEHTNLHNEFEAYAEEQDSLENGFSSFFIDGEYLLDEV